MSPDAGDPRAQRPHQLQIRRPEDRYSTCSETDLDISPPGSLGRGWSVDCSAKPARTDRTAQGLGSFRLKGRWFVEPERVDLDLELDRTGLGEMTALLRGQTGSVHGTLTSRLHLGGRINNIGIAGRLHIEDVHRWDLLPPTRSRAGRWTSAAGWTWSGSNWSCNRAPPRNMALPLTVRFRASDYLSQPHWAVAVNWNRFPAGAADGTGAAHGRADSAQAASWAARSMAPSAIRGRAAFRASWHFTMPR